VEHGGTPGAGRAFGMDSKAIEELNADVRMIGAIAFSRNLNVCFISGNFMNLVDFCEPNRRRKGHRRAEGCEDSTIQRFNLATDPLRLQRRSFDLQHFSFFFVLVDLVSNAKKNIR
jgi:hypothetical protein